MTTQRNKKMTPTFGRKNNKKKIDSNRENSTEKNEEMKCITCFKSTKFYLVYKFD
jgi:hypothetical protein